MSKNIHIIIGLLLFLLTIRCARVGSITGGPKDIMPPEVLECEPLNYSTNFTEDRIMITFDEFIKPASFSQELLASPPLLESPEIFIKNKTLVIDLESELMKNTTYTFDFGDAIKDNNEGNVLDDFQYVFSTGSYLDSLSLQGKAINAFDHEPLEEEALVMLYEQLYDSVPYDTIPKFLGRIDKRGYFSINNIPPDTFLIFALQDVNNNYLYDQLNEQIGFSDSLIHLTPDYYEEKNDSLQDSIDLANLKNKYNLDSLFEAGTLDSTDIDSLLYTEQEKEKSDIQLFMFTEDKEKQYLKDYTRKKDNFFTIVFNRPLKDSLTIKLLSDTVDGKWYLKQKNGLRDTIDFWITDSSLINEEDIETAVTYQKKDSMGAYAHFTDTLEFSFSRKKSKTDEQTDTIARQVKIKHSIKGKQDLNKPLIIITDQPTFNIDTSKIVFSYQEDTLWFPLPFKLSRVMIKGTDTVPDYNKYKLNHDWAPEIKYMLTLYPGAITDVYGATNDTAEINFYTHALEDYGSLYLELSNVNTNLIIQLFNEKEKLIREQYINSSGKIAFKYLLPGSGFELKIIYDKNNNRRWDTGDYSQKRQPEKVIFYKGSLEIRENWDLELIWEID